MKHIYIALLLLLFFSCKKEVQESNKIIDPSDDQINAVDTISKKSNSRDKVAEFVPQSTDEQTANNLKNFLALDYLKEDLALLQSNDRKFQFYRIDLNGDGNKSLE